MVVGSRALRQATVTATVPARRHRDLRGGIRIPNKMGKWGGLTLSSSPRRSRTDRCPAGNGRGNIPYHRPDLEPLSGGSFAAGPIVVVRQDDFPFVFGE
ncbi:hypothetical protein GCM10027456_34870 [Kineosporia babensis]